MPRPGEVLGLVGTNGIGKSTALKILAGKVKPNLGRFAVMKQRDVCQQFSSIYSIFAILYPCRIRQIGRKSWRTFEDLNSKTTLQSYWKMTSRRL